MRLADSGSSAPVPVRQAPARLEYGPVRAAGRGRRYLWPLLAGLAVVTGVILWNRYGPAVQERARLLSWQDRCLRFSPPADTIGYDDDVNRAPALLAAPNYAPPRTSVSWPREKIWGWRPPAMAVFSPPALRERPLYGRTTAVFLHARHDGQGRRRLVHIDVTAHLTPSWTGGTLESTRALRFWANARRPASWTTDAHDTGYSHCLTLSLPAHTEFRLSAGRPNPADLSHFTFEYEMNGWTGGVIDGWLRDDGTVEMKVWNGPAANFVR